jgi:hypothetical protein
VAFKFCGWMTAVGDVEGGLVDCEGEVERDTRRDGKQSRLEWLFVWMLLVVMCITQYENYYATCSHISLVDGNRYPAKAHQFVLPRFQRLKSSAQTPFTPFNLKITPTISAAWQSCEAFKRHPVTTH